MSKNKSHVWHAGMTTYNAPVAFIIHMIKTKAISDHIYIFNPILQYGYAAGLDKKEI
jgi:hypothetical protein